MSPATFGIGGTPEQRQAAKDQRQAAKDQRQAERERLQAEEAQRLADAALATVRHAAAAVTTAHGRGATLVAYRNLEATSKKWYSTNSDAMVEWALAEAKFDSSVLYSPRYGFVAALDGGSVEVFRDWIVYGQAAHDVETTTRGQVYTDGAVQVSSAVVLDKKGRQQVVQKTHDLRTAHMQLVSGGWSMSIRIHPDLVNEARRCLDQLNAHVASLGPAHATVSDLRAMVDAILNNSGQPPAEKLQQLSNLRYERLLSDEEFERAKTKILGI